MGRRSVFIYEYFTAGGARAAPYMAPSLLAEGTAIIDALAADFSAVPDTDVVLLRDARLALHNAPGTVAALIDDAQHERPEFVRCAAACDLTVVVAPEQGRTLVDRIRWVEAVGGRLLSPSSTFAAIASDKNETAARLADCGVPVPLGRPFQPGRPLPTDMPYPLVIKPADGAGSEGIQRLETPTSTYDATHLGSSARLETFFPGTAASVAVLCGPAVHVPLPPCSQRLSDDGHFRYLGGSTPLAPPLAVRAQRLALAALACLPRTQGYVGVDLILGEAEDGSADCVVEINPRLTTSYTGLRRLLQTNLAVAMLAAAEGRHPELQFASRQVEFTASGAIYDPARG